MTHPSSLFDQAISQLEKLSEILAGNIPSNSRSCRALPRNVRLSKETLLTISVLLPKLEAMRAEETTRRTGRDCPECGE